MHKVQQQRKKDLASTFVKILQELNLHETANILIKQANLLCEKNIEQDIRQIMNEVKLNEIQKSKAIQLYFRCSIKNYLKQNKIQQALQIYQVFIPMYIPSKMQQFSFLFAQTQQQINKQVNLLLQTFMGKLNIIPQNKKSSINFINQIWFLKNIDNFILFIDCKSNATIIDHQNQIKYHRQQLHKQKIICVSISLKSIFATGSIDKIVNIWDNKINLLHKIDIHKTRINTLLFYQDYLAVFDKNCLLTLHQIISNQKVVLKTAFKTLKPFIDVKYSPSKKKIYGVQNNGKKGQINSINIDKKRIQKFIMIQNCIYSIEIGIDQKLIFANLAHPASEIRAYSLTANYELLYTFSGFLQQKNLMRMCQGGKDGRYLAVTSEQGSVRIYDIKQQQQMLRLIGQSKKSINCVLWMQDSIYFGCDGGNIECWVPGKLNRKIQIKIGRQIIDQKMELESDH